MNSKIVSSTKKINALFLAIVLVVGIITLASPSFMTAGIAQAQPYYDGMDSDRKSYESNSYDSTDYGIDKDRKAYGTDSYKPKYLSDGKDDRDKSKDTKNVDIKKLKCININVNINGNNTGDVNLGNKDGIAADAEEGYLGTYSSDGSGGYSGEGYYDNGYNNKRDKGFDCIINNNNNNTNVVVGGGGNVTDGNGNVIDTCAECFTTNLNATEISRLLSATVLFSTLDELCNFIDENFQNPTQRQFISSYLLNAALIAGIPTDKINDILDCLEEIYGVVFPRTIDRDSLLQARLTNSNSLGSSIASNINTDTTSAFDINTAGDLTPSFSSPPTMSQGTEEEDLSALEKIAKLNQQWMELTS